MASILLLGLIPVATHVPALAALGLVAAVSVGLIVYEVVRHRESRAWIRSSRGAFTREDLERFIETHPRERPRPRARSFEDAAGEPDRGGESG
jgi:hypothetical protein